MRSKKSKKSKTPEEWGSIYKERYATYDEFTKNLKKRISKSLKTHKIKVTHIDARTKDVDEFIKKIKKEGKDYGNPLNEITDLVGIRIISYYKEDVDKIGKIIEEEFDIDWENSIDKTKILDPDRFGYLSIHYVISLSSSRKSLSEWKNFEDLKAEIQVRTILQHAWAEIDHELRYKKDIEIPKELKRKLFSLSALLEISDGVFSDLRRHILEVEEYYTREIGEGQLHIELNLSSLGKYLDFTRQHLKWMKIAEELDYQSVEDLDLDSTAYSELSDIAKRNLLKILSLVGITTISELDEILKDADSWGRDILYRIVTLYVHEDYALVVFPYDIISFIILYARKTVIDEKIIKQIGLGDTLEEVIKEVLDISVDIVF